MGYGWHHVFSKLAFPSASGVLSPEAPDLQLPSSRSTSSAPPPFSTLSSHQDTPQTELRVRPFHCSPVLVTGILCH